MPSHGEIADIRLQKPMKGDALLARRAKRKSAKAAEDAVMRAAKRRDGNKCRWPRCEFQKQGFTVHACHNTHRGAGGNPKGDRTTKANLIALCARHHTLWDDVAAIDITPQDHGRGFDGPADFWVRAESGRMELIAREKSIGISVERS